MDTGDTLKTKYASVAITVAIVLMLILSGPANAVRMEISVDNTTPAQGEEITFTVKTNITGDDRYVLIENYSLLMSKDGSTVRNVEFAPNGTILSDDTGISIDPIAVPSSSDYGHGPGYGYDSGYGYGYSFGYGYGYGYGNGAGGGTVVYEYNVTINTSGFDIGEYNAQVLLNTGNSVKSNFSSLETSFTISSKQADISDYVEPDGTVNNTFSITSASGNLTLTVPNGTIAKDSSGNALNTSMTIGTKTSNSSMDLALTSSESVVGKVVELGPSGATFDPYIQVRFDYDDADISGLDESKLKVKFFNVSTNKWESQTVVERNTTANYIIANIEHFSDFAVVGTATTTDGDNSDSGSSGGSSSGSGGGGGAASGESYENILTKEVQSSYVYKDTKMVYEFSGSDNPVTSVQFYALTNSGRVAASIEVLRGRSSYADSEAPGNVYQQMNIWVGRPGIINSETAKDFLIDFKVEKSWLEENNIDAGNIRLFRHADEKWNELPTSQTSEDEEYVYFESQTPGFSAFAIAAVEESELDEVSLSEQEDDSSEIEFGNETRESGDSGLPGFEALTLIVAMGAVVGILSRYKREGEE